MELNSKLEQYRSVVSEKYNLNLYWIKRNYENLLKDYRNKYVAVKDKNVVDRDLATLKYNLLGFTLETEAITREGAK